MSTTAFLLVRAQGGLWALPNDSVGRVDALGRRDFRVGLGGATVRVEEVLRLVRDLAVVPVGEVVRWAVPAGCRGLALCEHGPLLVVDGNAPPEVLTAPPEGGPAEGNGEERDDSR